MGERALRRVARSSGSHTYHHDVFSWFDTYVVSYSVCEGLGTVEDLHERNLEESSTTITVIYTVIHKGIRE